MTEAQQRDGSTQSHEELYSGLDPNSYTAQRLKHASATHLHLTTRRCFIGPIPVGWLKSHRKSWYPEFLHPNNYSSRAATFTASSDVTNRRQTTGLDSRISNRSFPQPADIGDSNNDDEEESDSDSSEDGSTMAISMNSESPRDPELAQIDESPNNSHADMLDGARDPPMRKKSNSRSRFRLASKRAKQKRKGSASSFVTARTQQAPTFVTARTDPMSPTTPSFTPNGRSDTDQKIANRTSSSNGNLSAEIARENGEQSSAVPSASNEGGSPTEPTGSTSSLILHKDVPVSGQPNTPAEEIPDRPSRPVTMRRTDPEIVEDEGDDVEDSSKKSRRHLKSLRFNVPERQEQVRGNMERIRRRANMRRKARNPECDGAIIRVNRMLVRVEATKEKLPDNYDENYSIKTETRTLARWSEFVVTCRQGAADETEFFLQLYKSRVIPAVDKTHVQKRPAYDIPLAKKHAKVNLYSSLDKTVVVWVKDGPQTNIYILRPRSSAQAVEWYTFLRDVLGWKRSSTLQVNVPDLSIQLHLERPFEAIEISEMENAIAKGRAAEDAKSLMENENVAHKIINHSMDMLQGSTEWSSVFEAWSRTEKMGLAWKRYDRLEWVHGLNERKMYGTMAMQNSHDLELRPKLHYPTHIPRKEGHMKEPPPLEGFLVRLTSQKGVRHRFGKMFYKRLYFSTNNEYLCFSRPARATPPPPPDLPTELGDEVPSAVEISKSTPLIYAVRPFLPQNNKIPWLQNGSVASIRKHDKRAADEAERIASNLLRCDGYIDLTRVKEVRHMVRGAVPADDHIDSGSDVDFHEDVPDTMQNDGTTDELDDDRIFELVLNNGLVIRLQAYNQTTKKEWIRRLRTIVKYWHLRKRADIDLLKSVRHQNLSSLNIDEAIESQVGQYASKWEVSRSYASPRLYNMCGLSCCRAITLSGMLYHKHRRHRAFTRCNVILVRGHLLIFQDSLRNYTGAEVANIHHDLQQSLPLQNCYVYSGLITESDLLYQNQTFDANNPGHNALPRIFPNDGWSSVDEDTMSCFVVWHGLQKSFFRAREEDGEGGKKNTLKRVAKLGVPGRSMVFKCRSRAERDLWVTALNGELERLDGDEEVRVEEVS
ncbi:MAG: hypothetical protein M1834_008659 [Cirrosporium novae-zelandiae]|nr:MAG: hypothetical protein M1834_008659 [Cirrosporium novae-zelandiae]